ncbi:MAG: undecaprenyl-phosphate glucose phosphotransferase [Anaerolineae bacterium]
MSRKHRLQFLFTLLLIAADAAMAALAFWSGYRLRLLTDSSTGSPIPPFDTYLGMMLIQVATVPVVFFFAKMYHMKRAASRVDEFYGVFGSVSVGILVSTAVTSFVYKGALDFPRLMVIYAWVLTIVLVMVGRLLHGGLRNLLRRAGIGCDRVIIVGTGEAGQMLLQKVQFAPHLGYQPIGFVTVNGSHDGGPASLLNLPVLGSAEDLSEIIDEYEIDEVLIGMPEAPREQMLQVVSKCERGRIGIKVLPDVFQIIASELSIGDLNGLPMLTLRDVALRGWKLTLKRAFDLVVGWCLLVLLSPAMVLLALLVKLDSRGAALYVQERMGMDAKPFPMIKFRTMRVDAEQQTGPVWATPNDPRRTRMGAFLRRTSLDELPQLINVVLGEMSLVGPRPERPMFVAQFRESIPRYMDRHREKAGMTGWAQVNGLRGDTSIVERTKYDVWYVENWSLLLDIKILIRQGLRMFRRDPNAY